MKRVQGGVCAEFDVYLETLTLTVLCVHEWSIIDSICDTTQIISSNFQERCGLMLNTLMSFTFANYKHCYICLKFLWYTYFKEGLM